jgi:hypothetical protein
VDSYFQRNGSVSKVAVTCPPLIDQPLLGDMRALLMTFGICCRVSEDAAVITLPEGG